MGGTGRKSSILFPQRDRGTRPGSATGGPGHPAGLWRPFPWDCQCSRRINTLCSPSPWVMEGILKGSTSKSQAGIPSIPLLRDPTDPVCVCKGLGDPGIRLGDLEAAEAHRDSLGTPQGTIPGLQPFPKGTDTSPSRHYAQHQQKKPQICAEPRKAGTKPERVFTHVTEAKPLSEPFCQSDTFRVI